MSELHWKGGAGNTIAITDDGCVYTIQAVADRQVLQAIDTDGFTRMGGTGFFGVRQASAITEAQRADQRIDEGEEVDVRELQRGRLRRVRHESSWRAWAQVLRGLLQAQGMATAKPRGDTPNEPRRHATQEGIMNTDHVYTTDYAGIDPEKAICTTCGGLRQFHTTFISVRNDPVDMVNHPPHYSKQDGVDFECIELARRYTFDVGNAVKYMWRTDRKNGREDVAKARWYVKDAINTVDNIYCDLRLEMVEHTKELVRQVAVAQVDASRQWFFFALYRSNLPEALCALNEILGEE
jgi:hypothetical protein